MKITKGMEEYYIKHKIESIELFIFDMSPIDRCAFLWKLEKAIYKLRREEESKRLEQLKKDNSI